ncbi:hypothetical protein ATANTOWER_003698 [Ataeniobius toweri]|uniref:Uncharacterized protein n=1 Tax=Ataeniobius toweri TaxID=208326 RepID=A0ABU7BGT4_9TELE|nr:hypothetical protein [Ataeniobius toweri]
MFVLFVVSSDLKHLNSGDKAPTSVNPLGVYDLSTAHWLQGKGQQDNLNQNTQTEEKSRYVAGKTEEFNRRLREQPADTQLWIKFIHYQVMEALLGFELS